MCSFVVVAKGHWICQKPISKAFNFSDWWEAKAIEAKENFIWAPISSTEVEYSYSAFNYLFTAKRQTLTLQYVADYLFVMHNNVPVMMSRLHYLSMQISDTDI